MGTTVVATPEESEAVLLQAGVIILTTVLMGTPDLAEVSDRELAMAEVTEEESAPVRDITIRRMEAPEGSDKAPVITADNTRIITTLVLDKAPIMMVCIFLNASARFIGIPFVITKFCPEPIPVIFLRLYLSFYFGLGLKKETNISVGCNQQMCYFSKNCSL